MSVQGHALLLSVCMEHLLTNLTLLNVEYAVLKIVCMGITVTYKKLYRMENFVDQEDIVQTEQSTKMNSLVQLARLVQKLDLKIGRNVNHVHLVITVNLKLSKPLQLKLSRDIMVMEKLAGLCLILIYVHKLHIAR